MRLECLSEFGLVSFCKSGELVLLVRSGWRWKCREIQATYLKRLLRAIGNREVFALGSRRDERMRGGEPYRSDPLGYDLDIVVATQDMIENSLPISCCVCGSR